MLVIDHSGSMAATDVQPTRLAAAERAANTFIDQLPSDGTRRRDRLLERARRRAGAERQPRRRAGARSTARRANGATATGDALELALAAAARRRTSKHPPSAIVLLSDGAANAGVRRDRRSRARRRTNRIPIDTVALGTPSGTLAEPRARSSRRSPSRPTRS